MPTVAIIGASRGIGLGFVEAYAADGWTVHATTRAPASPGALGTVDGDVTLHGLDVANGRHIAALAAELGNTALDVLIHNAGVYGDGMSREQVMAINAEAPIALVEALLPAVARGAQAGPPKAWIPGSAGRCLPGAHPGMGAYRSSRGGERRQPCVASCDRASAGAAPELLSPMESCKLEC